MKQLLILFFLLTVVSIAQTIDAPTGYTPFLGLRQYAYEANPGADSLNQNNTDIDTWAKATQDSLASIKADLYSVVSYSGGIINGTVTWDDISISGKSNIVQMTGTQTNIAGPKGFTDALTTEGIFPSTTNTYYLGDPSYRWRDGYFQYIHVGGSSGGGISIHNDDGSDSAKITFDGTKVDFGTAKVKIDTLDAENQNMSLRQKDFTLADLADTVLTMANLTSSLYIELSGNATAGIEKILCDETVPSEFLLYITTDNNTYSILFEDGETDGNLLLNSDFTLSKGDMLVLKSSYRMNALETLHWQEVGRSDN